MKSVLELLKVWRKINGMADPRPMLDSYFYSYIFINDSRGYENYDKKESWCDEALGHNHWVRFFNKFWFTNQEQLVQFKLTWYEEDNGSGNLS